MNQKILQFIKRIINLLRAAGILPRVSLLSRGKLGIPTRVGTVLLRSLRSVGMTMIRRDKIELLKIWRWEKEDWKNLLKKLHTRKFHVAFAIALIAVIGYGWVFHGNPKSALSATFYFTQSDWSGGISATAAVHPTDATNWNKYTFSV